MALFSLQGRLLNEMKSVNIATEIQSGRHSEFLQNCLQCVESLVGHLRVNLPQAASAGGAGAKLAPAGRRSHPQAPASTHSLTAGTERGEQEPSSVPTAGEQPPLVDSSTVKLRSDALMISSVLPACRCSPRCVHQLAAERKRAGPT